MNKEVLDCQRSVSKIFYPVKSEKIGVVGIIWPSQSVIKGGAGGCDNIVIIENPINVLEAGVDGIRMAENDRANRPIA